MFRIGLLLIVAASIGLAVTNPGADVHKKAVYSQMPQEYGAQGMLGDMAGELLGSLDVLPLEYNNYVLFSTATLRDDVVSVGMLTKVWAAD